MVLQFKLCPERETRIYVISLCCYLALIMLPAVLIPILCPLLCRGAGAAPGGGGAGASGAWPG